MGPGFLINFTKEIFFSYVSDSPHCTENCICHREFQITPRELKNKTSHRTPSMQLPLNFSVPNFNFKHCGAYFYLSFYKY